MAEQYEVDIQAHGRAGVIQYREAAGAIKLDWEFGGGTPVVIIEIPPADKWSLQYPWAQGRREEILNRVAQEVIRQKAPSCSYSINDLYSSIYINEPAR